MALLINKYHPINYGRVVLVTDSLIICSSLLVGNGIETVIYGFLLTAVFGLSTDALLAGNQQSNQILVISHEPVSYTHLAEDRKMFLYLRF